VRESHQVVSADGLSTSDITTHLLELRDSYWNEEALQWRMKFVDRSNPGIEPFWIDHCKVRAGDEIPKVSTP